jgi:hypothetical protein
VFTDGRQRQPNHNATTYCVYWQTTTTNNIQILVEEKKNNLIQSFCHITQCSILVQNCALCATKKINILTLVLFENKNLNESNNHPPPPLSS